MRYNVLWIDDEYEKQLDFIGEAEQEGIDICPFSSHEEGMARLNRDLDFFHAVILDAKVKNNKDDTVTGLRGLMASRDRINEIRTNGYLPSFIFTGQPDYVDKDWFMESYGKYYIKTIDNEALFTDLKKAIEKKEEYIIHKKYKIVFEVCSDKYVGEATSKHLMDILKSIENQNEKFDDEKYFNGLRKVIEHVFRASNKLGLLHDKCIPKGIVNLTWCRFFMTSNKEFTLNPSEEKIGCSTTHFPLILANNVKSILDISSAASHTEEEKEYGKINFSEYKKQIHSNYLLYSLAFQVMDLLIWFKNYADENPDKEKNKLLWKSFNVLVPDGEWQKGEIIRIAENGYGTFQPDNGGNTLSIIPVRVKELRLILHQKIKVTTRLDSSGTKSLIENIRSI